MMAVHGNLFHHQLVSSARRILVCASRCECDNEYKQHDMEKIFPQLTVTPANMLKSKKQRHTNEEKNYKK